MSKSKWDTCLDFYIWRATRASAPHPVRVGTICTALRLRGLRPGPTQPPAERISRCSHSSRRRLKCFAPGENFRCLISSFQATRGDAFAS
ncbi:hypothetical protein O181_013797 [Austropuccinia psidii MF-1]|uniref:Uncharacterized protein n=1 Tax=Austropuccinia psidii MF-1 TaxID=1389203 RepID=A0A9Q3BZ20_9BASI|nr:hypothetical protein [Austropuccinia psidii MF-1]